MSEVEFVSSLATSPATSRVIATADAVVGRIIDVRPHPNGERIWLASVDLCDDKVQIVFGGELMLTSGDLVPVAPPGARVTVEQVGDWAVPRTKKMRIRRYRGERSYGMLCSLVELGWACEGPDEVATLINLAPGYRLDEVPVGRRKEVLPPQLWPYLHSAGSHE